MGLEKHPVLVSVLVSKKLSGLGLGLEACGLDYNTATKFNSSDGLVVWSVCLLSCRLGFDYKSGQTNDFKIGIHSFPA